MLLLILFLFSLKILREILIHTIEEKNLIHTIEEKKINGIN